jgi:hypothetical protein
MKKTYVRPQLIKHGAVESVTQTAVYCASAPINDD